MVMMKIVCDTGVRSTKLNLDIDWVCVGSGGDRGGGFFLVFFIYFTYELLLYFILIFLFTNNITKYIPAADSC